MQSFNVAEKKAIKELRQRVTDILEPPVIDDDLLFHRFLTARDFKLDQAEDMLRKDVAWRKVNQIERILKDYKPVEVLEKYFAYRVIGYDKEGSPVTYCPAGIADTEGVLKSATINEFKSYFTYNLERDRLLLKKQTEELGKPVTKLFSIFDLENITFAKATNRKNLEPVLQFIALLQDHYPETAKAIYVINAPFYFTMAFALLKAIMGEGLLRKIRIFGSSGWKEALLQKVDTDQLPEFLGGIKKNPDIAPCCPSFVSWFSVVPEHYYICNSRKPLSRKTDAKKVVVNPRSKFEVKVKVNEPETFIEWEYEIKSKDIGFGLLLLQNISDDKSKVAVLIPTQKVYCSEGYETGRYLCEEAGTYIIVFDNSYSWVQYKELYYRAAIISPTNQKMN